MPRVTNPPSQRAGVPQMQSSLKIPLNDDRQEKAVRFQSRQALHDLQMNQIKAAASPVRKLNNYERAASSSPKTPQSQRNRGKGNGDDGGLLAVVAGNSMTPMKRVPILANFEEWMKMATDNKINAANSWNFALIDYFHDMSLLKEGDGVNFQKASCTLDGCVKIYTSRVDSVATETGKLLSGLADSGNKKQKGEEGEGEDGEEEDEEGEDGVRKRVKSRAQRSSEATLVPSFAQLQLKKFELEFSVDPLFKKASADFDEGGAKGLLLNHLAIDAEGRIVFDSSDDAEAVSGVEDATSSGNDAEAAEAAEGAADEDRVNGVDGDDMEIDIKSLQLKFFPDLNTLDGQDICPSLKTFDLGDPAAILDIPFLKASEDQKSGEDDSPLANLGDRSGIFLDGDNAFDDDDMGLSSADIPLDTEFGEGGEAWARNAALEPQNRLLDTNIEGVQNDGNHEQEFQLDGYDVAGKQHGISLQHIRSEGTHEDILSYFDNALRKNWAGPEHWRIRRMKDITKSSTLTPLKRKEKEPFEVDFIANLEPSLAELIYTPASSNSTISLPRTQWKSKNRNLLPDDKHFNSRQLLRFFLKPRARLGTRRILPNSRDDFAATKPTIELPDGEMDEAFWARQGNASHSINHEGDVAGNYDANFFQDDGLVFPGGPPDDDEDDFADAREAFSPGLDGVVNEGIPGMDGILTSADNAHVGGFGSQLVTQSKRLRPEYVQYARVAKKVDVRRLKEEIWKGIGLGENPLAETSLKSGEQAKEEEPLKFTSVMNSLQRVYPKQAMADISTSYCFICLLHLANEKGLTLSNEEGLEELSIKKDIYAEPIEG